MPPTSKTREELEEEVRRDMMSFWDQIQDRKSRQSIQRQEVTSTIQNLNFVVGPGEKVPDIPVDKLFQG